MEKDEQLILQFLGAAGTVTGSKYLLSTPTKKILIDCGLFQGLKELRLLNWADLPFDPSTIDKVLLTHGHLDHVGYLPRLVRSGFRGEIWGTKPTLEIAEVILKDSAKIQEEDAQRANELGYSKHKPALALYDTKAVDETIPLFVAKAIDEWIEIGEDMFCRFNYNSHILGAAHIEIKYKGKIILFSGDIGRDDDPLMYAPKKPKHANVVLIESTYGDRSHPKESIESLSFILKDATKDNGTVLIPSFAVERTQLLMYLIWQLKKSGELKSIPVYMDSPMGTNILELFIKNPSWHKLSGQICEEISKTIRIIRTMEESISLAASSKTKIIIAGSGMATGGRMLTYFENYLSDNNATILLVGYQAEGTRGRRLLDGEPRIKLHGKYIDVKAKIKQVEGLSSHADQDGLIDWLKDLDQKPEKIFITHGEKGASIKLKQKIKEVYGLSSELPTLNEIFDLDAKQKEK